jgi:hypothetical protein
VRRVGSVDLGQQNEQPPAHEHGDLRGERVVVAERDLVRSGRVFSFTIGDDTELERHPEHVAGH